jgi:hypothetical protein
MNSTKKLRMAVRQAVATAAKRCRGEYIVCLALGRKNKNGRRYYDLTVACSSQKYGRFFEADTKIVKPTSFQRRYGQMPFAIIYFHVTGQPLDLVVKRLMTETKNAVKDREPVRCDTGKIVPTLINAGDDQPEAVDS